MLIFKYDISFLLGETDEYTQREKQGHTHNFNLDS